MNVSDLTPDALAELEAKLVADLEMVRKLRLLPEEHRSRPPAHHPQGHRAGPRRRVGEGTPQPHGPSDQGRGASIPQGTARLPLSVPAATSPASPTRPINPFIARQSNTNCRG